MLRTSKNNRSKLGLQKIYSTKDPAGNPATIGETAAQILRDNFDKLEDALENKIEVDPATGKISPDQLPSIEIPDISGKADLEKAGKTVIYGTNGKISEAELNTDLLDKINNSADSALEKRLYGESEILIPKNVGSTISSFTANGHYYYQTQKALKDKNIQRISLNVVNAGTLTLLAGKNVNASNYTFRELGKLDIKELGLQTIEVDITLNDDELFGFGIVGDTLQFYRKQGTPNSVGGGFYYKASTWSTLNDDLCIEIFGSDKDAAIGDINELYRLTKQVGNDFTQLTSDSWDGSNKFIQLSSDTNIYLNTQRSSGTLYVSKGWYDNYQLQINGNVIDIKGNTVLKYINMDGSIILTAHDPKAYIANLGNDATGVKTFTGKSSEVIKDNTSGLLTSGAFSMGVKARISTNGFVAIGRGTTTARNWDFIFSNYENQGRVTAALTVAGTKQAVTGNLPLNTWVKFIVTYNGAGGMSLYQDGIKKADQIDATITNGGQFLIGQVIDLISRNSSIDDLFFVNKSLTQSEVTEMLGLKSPLESSFKANVVKYWDFEDGGVAVPPKPQAVFSQKYAPILERGSASWESGDIANPDVLEDTLGKSGYKYIMNYSGYGTMPNDSSAKWRMCLAYSNDLEHWVRDPDNPIFSPNENEGYISCNGSIAILGGLYYHFYQRGNSADIASSQICLATSPDLKTWTRQNGGNPVILPTPGSFDDIACFDPCVRAYDDLFYMLYCANGGNNAKIGLATSVDGINWTKKGAIITQTGGASEPSFVKTPKGWYITHDIYTGANREIYGIWWDGKSPVVTEKILARGQAEWKSASVFDSALFYLDGKLYMYYAGGNVATPNEGLNANIGIAVALV
jgi:predicted GH43/DUF377 family glycosyl hydrolase